MKKFYPTTGAILEGMKAGHPILRGAAPAVVQRDPGDASIGLGNFTQGIPAFWFARATEFGSNENLYTPFADSPWVRSAIQKIAGPISSCQLLFSRPSSTKVRQKGPNVRQLSTSRGIVYRNESELMDLPQLDAWLKEPVRDLGYSDFVEASIGWLKMQECFWIIPPAKKIPFPEASSNPYPQIMVAQPDRMRPTIKDGEIAGWSYVLRGGRTLNLQPSDVVRLRGWNPYDDFRGLGDYRAVHIAAEADWLACKFSRNLMANNGDTSRIISVKSGMPDDRQRQQLISGFKERRRQSMRGIIEDVVVGGEVELHNAELASVDPSFVSQRIENRHEIYIGMGVPPSMADIKASYSIGSASDMFQLLINTCIPTGGKLCGALEKLIYLLTGERIEVGLNWDEHPCMQEVRKERLDAIAKLAAQGMPMEQINEYLALGLVKYPGWEIGYVPIAITPVLGDDGEPTKPATPDDFAEPIDDGSETPADGDSPEVKAMVAALQHRCNPVFRGNPKNKTLWESHMRLRSAAIKQYQGKAGKLFNQYRASALKKLATATAGKAIVAKGLVDLIFDKNKFSNELVQNLDPVSRAVLQRAGEELISEIGSDDPWKMAPAKVTQFIRQRDKLVSSVGETAQAQLNTTLAEGVEGGETTAQLSDRVRATFNKLSNYEAKRIAMTETAAAYGYSRHEAMTDAGIEYKSWLSSHGPTVRPAHAIAEDTYGETPIPVDEPFEVDGEELMYPGDPAGSPGNVINCHCIQIAAQAPDDGGDQ